ncbi:MAG: aminotransferase class III-fold pyridoxal phosphate-dependent enzyme [Chloroflexi bacterium]|nr:aminotransferase class III-fold pyridoxal phosphate-dependent enzyme [Chloroflexota bacterium]
MNDAIPKHERLLQGLFRDYEARYPTSKSAHERAKKVLIDGVSHGARLFKPYPFRVIAAQGAHVTDIDGHRIVDFWQGHYANILGHNPAIIREVLVRELEHGFGLQTGLPEERQSEFAQALAQAAGAERVRLTTAGTLATMYAIMLARAFTKRHLVLKVAGGWHGASPLALKGVGRRADGYDHVDSAGVPATTEEEILVVRFNDVEALKHIFARYGERIACFIFEPCVGAAGFLPASGDFMRTARELTRQYGALLILDEVITGFRFCAGGVQKLYGVQADLTTFGKIIGGGMPLSAVAGRADVMELVSESATPRVWFNGGTFSAHPLALLAGQAMIEHLIAHEAEIYPALAAKGQRLREGVEAVFKARGVLARCTGHGNDALQGGSLATIYFPRDETLQPTSAEDLQDPALCDVILREQVLKVGLLLHDVNVAHGLGALSASHDDEDLAQVFQACDAFATRLLAGK